MVRMKAIVLGLALAFPASAMAQDLSQNPVELPAPGSSPGAAGQDQTLADIRQELSGLYTDIQRLRSELSTTGATTGGPVIGDTALARLDAIELQLQQLTSKTEALEFRINRITVDGTNRIGDLEFRICEVEPGCDIGSLGDTPSLGGVDSAANVPTAAPPPPSGGPALAIGEQNDFERAREALASGDFRSAADQFAAFVETYPGGPLNSEAFFLRGQALEELGEMTDAARAYLDSFSGNPAGDRAPEALLKLGTALAAIGQGPDACLTLGEVSTRFPTSPVVNDARMAMMNLGCS